CTWAKSNPEAFFAKRSISARNSPDVAQHSDEASRRTTSFSTPDFASPSTMLAVKSAIPQRSFQVLKCSTRMILFLCHGPDGLWIRHAFQFRERKDELPARGQVCRLAPHDAVPEVPGKNEHIVGVLAPHVGFGQNRDSRVRRAAAEFLFVH